MSIFFTRYQCLARSVLVYVAFVHINTWFGGPQAILVLRVLDDTSPDFSVRSIPPLCEREAERDCHYYIGPDVRPSVCSSQPVSGHHAKICQNTEHAEPF